MADNNTTQIHLALDDSLYISEFISKCDGAYGKGFADGYRTAMEHAKSLYTEQLVKKSRQAAVTRETTDGQ